MSQNLKFQNGSNGYRTWRQDVGSYEGPNQSRNQPGMNMIELPYGLAERIYFHHLSSTLAGAPELTPARVRELISEEELTPFQREWWLQRLQEDFEDDDGPMGQTFVTWVLTHIEAEPPYLDPWDPEDYDYLSR